MLILCIIWRNQIFCYFLLKITFLTDEDQMFSIIQDEDQMFSIIQDEDQMFSIIQDEDQMFSIIHFKSLSLFHSQENPHSVLLVVVLVLLNFSTDLISSNI